MQAVQKIVMTAEQQAAAKRKEELLAELAKLGGVKQSNIRFTLNKFTDKKGVEQVNILVHGITAKPIPLYGSQALAFCQVTEELKTFVEENRAALSWKS